MEFLALENLWLLGFRIKHKNVSKTRKQCIFDLGKISCHNLLKEKNVYHRIFLHFYVRIELHEIV